MTKDVAEYTLSFAQGMALVQAGFQVEILRHTDTMGVHICSVKSTPFVTDKALMEMWAEVQMLHTITRAMKGQYHDQR